MMNELKCIHNIAVEGLIVSFLMNVNWQGVTNVNNGTTQKAWQLDNVLFSVQYSCVAAAYAEMNVSCSRYCQKVGKKRVLFQNVNSPA